MSKTKLKSNQLDITLSSSGLPFSQKKGLVLSNNASDANNDIDIAVGAIRDSTDAVNLVLASAITKRLDATWSVGTNQGGLDTGSKAISTWYHMFLITRSDTGVMDVLFSTSVASPTMPASYDYKRRIGAVKTDGSGNIIPFYEYANRFSWKTQAWDLFGGSVLNTRTLFTIPTPLGVKVRVYGVAFINTTNPTGCGLFVYDPDLTTGIMTVGTFAVNISTTVQGNSPLVGLITNTSSQLAYYVNTSGSAAYISIHGWEELWQV